MYALDVFTGQDNGRRVGIKQLGVTWLDITPCRQLQTLLIVGVSPNRLYSMAKGYDIFKTIIQEPHIMKRTLACLACAAALVPGVSSAKSGYFDTDTLTFAAGSTPVTVTFQWYDAVFEKNGNVKELDGNYRWVLTDLSTGEKLKENAIQDKVTGDTGGTWSGSFTHIFNLVEGNNYKLKFVGKWSGVPEGEKWVTAQNGNVTLAVPEPETYAMLLAGLGLIGTIARRRSVRR
jgi:hypothetical protein